MVQRSIIILIIWERILYLDGLGRTFAIFRNTVKEIPWQSSGYDSSRSLPRAWVQSLVGELRSRKLRVEAKKKN